MNLVPCRSCGKPIFFAVTANGKRMPVDPEPILTGSLIVTEHAGQEPTCAPAPLVHSGPKYLSHFASCEFASRHRKSNRKENHT